MFLPDSHVRVVVHNSSSSAVCFVERLGVCKDLPTRCSQTQRGELIPSQLTGLMFYTVFTLKVLLLSLRRESVCFKLLFSYQTVHLLKLHNNLSWENIRRTTNAYVGYLLTQTCYRNYSYIIYTFSPNLTSFLQI